MLYCENFTIVYIVGLLIQTPKTNVSNAIQVFVASQERARLNLTIQNAMTSNEIPSVVKKPRLRLSIIHPEHDLQLFSRASFFSSSLILRFICVAVGCNDFVSSMVRKFTKVYSTTEVIFFFNIF